MNSEDTVTYFGAADYRGKKTKFGIKAKDRARHVYVIGKTGMGKSTLLENMAVQDILSGEGMAFIDPHGGTADKLLEYIPEERIKDVVYFAPFDLENPVSFNVLEDIGFDKRHLVASGLMSTFKKIWVDAWSARMEYILNNTLLALLEYPNSTLLGVNRMLAEKDFRNAVVANVKDPSVKSFWTEEFAKFSASYMQEAGAAIQNKIGQFTANPIIRNIIGQPKSSFDIRKLMDEKKILIMNLSKGQIGEQNASLLGGMLITKIYLAAMSRADMSGFELKKLPNFYFYVDEFQSFANATFADILSEARKYKLNLTIAHQYIEQMEEEVRDAVFGNVGTTIAFRVGPFDAEVLEKIFAPTFSREDLVNISKYQIYLTLMVDGIGSRPFSAATLDAIPLREDSNKERVIRSSQELFGRPRKIVEEEINAWFAPITPPQRPRPQGEGEGNTGRPRSFIEERAPRSADRFEKPRPEYNRDGPSRPRPAGDGEVHTRQPRPHSFTEDRPQRLQHQKAEEKKPFASLKDMLAMLESGEVKEVKEVPSIPPQTHPPRSPVPTRSENSRPMRHPQHERSATRAPVQSTPRTIPLSSLKQPPVQSQNLSALRDVLASVTKATEAPVSTPAPLPKQQEVPRSATVPSIQQQRKEVSEDVLRKILE
ncbi:MAG: type IV secretion system DNA-binding domain-containing protein [Candidatus Pacebacteria bacterium]|jgi:hypothetical protein|nr:type IV secretion system DNA-binding domain-containing protein [Candidatus Paceibacterota bacterium]